VVAALSAWHEHHADAAHALREVDGLPAHVLLETYSVLTRLPGGLAVPPAVAARVLGERFGGVPLQLSATDRAGLVERLATAGVAGGSAYDGLIGLEAAAEGAALLTLDRRAQQTYRRLGVPFEQIGA
jgi:hypothetical protein